MNILRRTLDRIKQPFGKGQKFEKFAPAINAFDTFLFVPNHTTKKVHTFVTPLILKERW